jgi:CBS domain-containing protein
MRWSIRFARIAGIDLKIHVTFLLFLAWIGFTYYRSGGAEAAMAGTIFIYLGAGQEAALAQLKNLTTGVRVSEAMVTDLRTLPAVTRLSEVAEAVLRMPQHEFPVLDTDDRVLSVLSREEIINGLRRHEGDMLVKALMHCTPAPVRPEALLNEVVRSIRQSGCSALPVVDPSGRLLGMVTPENVEEMMVLRSLRYEAARSAWRQAA